MQYHYNALKSSCDVAYDINHNEITGLGGGENSWILNYQYD
ncbi:hypothetical protein [Methanobrevibacter millerae]|nr:hypothetical protein [Methanobrevibacter millerae]